jgi:hypothetical protein
VHLIGQSPVLSPTADIAAQAGQCRPVLRCLLLYPLDLECSTLLCGRQRGQDGQAVGQGPGGESQVERAEYAIRGTLTLWSALSSHLGASLLAVMICRAQWTGTEHL